LQRGPGLHAQQRLVRVRVLPGGVVEVVGGQQRGVDVPGQLEQLLGDPALDVQAVFHQLDVVVLLAEDVLHVGSGADRLLPLPEPEPDLDLPGRAAAGGDQPLGVGGQQLTVHPRPLAELALQGGQRAHPEQVVHPGVVLRQDGHVRVRTPGRDVVAGLALLAPAHPGLVEPAGARGDVGLHPDDRLDAVLSGLGPEVVSAEEVSVVGGGQSGLAQALRLREQVVQPGRAVQHRVLGVHVQVDEVGGHAHESKPDHRRPGRDPPAPAGSNREHPLQASAGSIASTDRGAPMPTAPSLPEGPWQRTARAAGLLRTTEVRPTIFAEMTALAQRTGALNLGQGFPDSDGPPSVTRAAQQAIADGVNQYPPGQGSADLRRAVAAHQQRHYHLDVDPDTEVLVTTGATEAIAAAVLALAGPGDEVLTLEPFYDSYAAVIALSGATHTTAGLQPTPEGFRLDVGALREAATARTRLILLNSPHNPTGAVLSADELAAVAAVAAERDAIVVTDEVYEHLTYDGAAHLPIATLPGMAARTLTLSSAGKSFAVPGWKIGWATGPAELVT